MSNDRALRYARAVKKGDIVASKHVRAACKRTIRLWNKHFCPKEYERMMEFVTSLWIVSAGCREQFYPFAWQEYVLVNLFCFKRAKGSQDNLYRLAYIETAKGSGKTPLGSIITLYATCRDPNLVDVRSLIYAPSRDQAGNVMNQCASIVKDSASLNDLLKADDKFSTGIIHDTGNRKWRIESRALPRSATKMGSGDEPTFILVEELHELLPSQKPAFHQLRKSFKSKANPLMVYLTNAPYSGMGSLCGTERGRAIVAPKTDGGMEDYFAFIACVDADEEADDEAMWMKANPSLPRTPRLDFLRSEMRVAKRSSDPAEMGAFLRLCMGVANLYNNADRIMERGIDPMFEQAPEELDSETPCWVGIDIGSGNYSLTGISIIWRDSEGDFCIDTKGYVAQNSVEKIAKKQFQPEIYEWISRGDVIALDAESVRPEHLIDVWNSIVENYNVRGVGADSYCYEDLLINFKRLYDGSDRNKNAYVPPDSIPLIRLFNNPSPIVKHNGISFPLGYTAEAFGQEVNGGRVHSQLNQFVAYGYATTDFQCPNTNQEMLFARHAGMHGYNKNDGFMSILHGFCVAWAMTRYEGNRKPLDYEAMLRDFDGAEQ